MLSPIAIATWISICIPWAEPNLAMALVDAGSRGEPGMIADDIGREEIAPSQTEATKLLRNRLSQTEVARNNEATELYIGLTQVPISTVRELTLDPEVALDKCANLEIGYTAFIRAYQFAEKSERDPWKRISVAYNYFRTRQKQLETPYSIRATAYLKSGKTTLPATIMDPLYHAIISESSAGLASRHAMRQSHNPSSVLIASRMQVDNIRKMH